MARRRHLLPETDREQLRDAMTRRLGLEGEVRRRGWAEMKTRDTGRIGGPIGGSVVRSLIRQAEEAMLRGERP